MALISSMGNSSSPLFLQSGESLGLNIAPLEYYYKKKEAADEDLAKKLAQKPKLNEFDEKLAALAGQKGSLKNIYNQKMGVVNKGVEKYGGIWAMYANSDEGRAAVSDLNDMTYNMQIGEDNWKRFKHEQDKVSTNKAGDLRHLTVDGYATLDDEGKTMSNEKYMQYLMKTPGVGEDGKLVALNINSTSGTSQNFSKEASDFYTKVGHKSYSNKDFALGQDKYGQPTFGTIEGNQGENAYSYITNSSNGGKSNKDNLNAAINVVSDSFSNEAKQGAINEIYDIIEGKKGGGVSTPQFNAKGEHVGFKKEEIDGVKFHNDKAYHNSVLNNYIYQRASGISVPFQVSETSSERNFQGLGAAKSSKEIKAAEEAGLSYTASLQKGLINPTESHTESFPIFNEEKGISEMVQYQTQSYGGIGFSQAYGELNKSLAENPTTLSGVFGELPIMVGGKINNYNKNHNPIVTHIEEVKFIPAMIKDPGSNVYRAVNKKEHNQYLAAIEQNKNINPGTLNAVALEAYNKNQSIINTFGLQAGYKVELDLGEDVDKMQEHWKSIDPTSGTEVPTADESYWFGINYLDDRSEAQGLHIDEDKTSKTYNHYIMNGYVPMTRSQGLEGEGIVERQGGRSALGKTKDQADILFQQNLIKGSQSTNNILTTKE